MKSKTARLHPLLVLLAVAMASVLFVVACGGSGEATEVAQVVEEAEVPEAVEEAEATSVAEAGQSELEAVGAAEGIVVQAVEAEAAVEATEAGTPKTGGKLTFALYATHITNDPPKVGVSVMDIAVTQAAYNNLLLILPDLTVKPELATHWEANADLSSYTFHLRKGVKFHHGKEFKAEDVLFTFERLLDPVLDVPARATFEVIEDIIAVDDYTVRFDLKGPNSFFPDSLSIYQARITPSDIDVDRLILEEFGTGPFMIVEHLPGERTSFVRNPDYWEEGKPYLDELVLQTITEVATRAEALKSGDVDIVYQLEPQSVAGLEAHPDTVVLSRPSLSWIGMYMQTDSPPFDNKLVRQAMQAATDRESINQAALLGLGEIAYDHPIPSSDPRFCTECELPEYDPELARSLLEQAGYPDGIDITLYSGDIGAGVAGMALAFKESAKAAGIRVDLRTITVDSFLNEHWNISPFAVTYWYGRPNPDQALSIQIMSNTSWNTPHYNNAELDALIIRARGETLEDQIATYAEIQRILIEDVPRIIPAYQPWLYGARANVRGVSPHPLGWPLVNDAWIDD